MPVVSEDDVRIRMLECKMRGEKPPTRCPLCWDEAAVESNEVPYGETYVTEFRHIECPTCGIVLECQDCYRYTLHEPEKHPCPDKLLENQKCRCPPPDESSSSTDPAAAFPASAAAPTDYPPKPFDMQVSVRQAKRRALWKSRYGR